MSSFASQPVAPISANVVRAASRSGAASSVRPWVTSQRPSSSSACAWKPRRTEGAQGVDAGAQLGFDELGVIAAGGGHEAAEPVPLGRHRGGRWPGRAASPGPGADRQGRGPGRRAQPGRSVARARRSRRRVLRPRAGDPRAAVPDGWLRLPSPITTARARSALLNHARLDWLSVSAVAVAVAAAGVEAGSVVPRASATHTCSTSHATSRCGSVMSMP